MAKLQPVIEVKITYIELFLLLDDRQKQYQIIIVLEKFLFDTMRELASSVHWKPSEQIRL